MNIKPRTIKVKTNPKSFLILAESKIKNKLKLTQRPVSDTSIYVLKDPITNEIRYVGKTIRSLCKRLYSHCMEKRRIYKTYKYNWILSLKKKNLKPLIQLIERVPLEKSAEREKYWIKFYKDLGYRLTNLSDGGEGPNGYKHTDDCKKRMSLLKLGRKHTDEWKEKMREKMKGRIFTEEWKDKISKAKKQQSQETRIKIGLKHKNKKVSEEARHKMRIAHLGKKIPVEVILKREATKKLKRLKI